MSAPAFATQDHILCAALASEGQSYRVVPLSQGKSVVFEFAPTPSLLALSAAYARGEIRVEPKTFSASIRAVRRAIDEALRVRGRSQ